MLPQTFLRKRKKNIGKMCSQQYLIWSEAFNYSISEHRPLTSPSSPLCPWTSVPAGAREDLSTGWCGLCLSSSCCAVSLSVYFPVGSIEELVGQCSNLVDRVGIRCCWLCLGDVMRSQSELPPTRQLVYIWCFICVSVTVVFLLGGVVSPTLNPQ